MPRQKKPQAKAKSPPSTTPVPPSTFFVFDTETTGLIRNRRMPLGKQPEVIEFYGALVDLSTGEIKAEAEYLIKPERAIPDEVIKITHITNEDVKDCQPFKAVADDIMQHLMSAPVLAHNLSFDKEMLDIEFERLERTITWPPGICTVEQTIHMRGYRLSLTALYEALFDETFADAHRARHDVEALIRCAVELRKRGDI